VITGCLVTDNILYTNSAVEDVKTSIIFLYHSRVLMMTDPEIVSGAGGNQM